MTRPMTSELQYNDHEIEQFKSFLAEMLGAVSKGSGEYADFEVAPGVHVACDWDDAEEYYDGPLPISVLIEGEGLDLFTRGVEDTLADTGALGHGPNHGDTLAADIEAWVAEGFHDGFAELVFEHADTHNGRGWLFTTWVPRSP